MSIPRAKPKNLAQKTNGKTKSVFCLSIFYFSSSAWPSTYVYKESEFEVESESELSPTAIPSANQVQIA